MNKGEMLYEGKAKKVYATEDPDLLSLLILTEKNRDIVFIIRLCRKRVVCIQRIVL